jgi:hypothetical protein
MDPDDSRPICRRLPLIGMIPPTLIMLLHNKDAALFYASTIMLPPLSIRPLLATHTPLQIYFDKARHGGEHSLPKPYIGL